MLRPRHRTRAPRRGVIAVFVALVLTVLVGALAIVLDGGLLQDDKREVQAAADAAAMDAAVQLFTNYPAIAGSNFTIYDPGDKASTAAKNSAAANGFPDDG